MDVTQLDGVSLILGALATGAGDGLKQGAKSAMTATVDAVGGAAASSLEKLVAMVRASFRSDAHAIEDLNVHLRRPSAETSAALSTHVIEAGLNTDTQVLETARAVFAEAGPAAVGTGSVAANIINATAARGGHTHIGGQQQYFGGESNHPR
ncbi:hypothetical protein [Williamsia maris]|uniref:hypothetical protein n=1 Tax=Williamsia maris TaxID=72806 RepID=UPI0020A48192|nr:hypothetical protein [Williamsia maris]